MFTKQVRDLEQMVVEKSELVHYPVASGVLQSL